MTRGIARLRAWGLALAGLATAIVAVVAATAPAHAQVDEARLRKIETEVRALQRKVFPGGDGRFFTPETGGQTGETGPALPPTTTAMTDVLARLDAMEAQLAQLTSQVETNTNAIAQLATRVGALEPKTAQPAGAAATVAPAAAVGAASAAGAAVAAKPASPPAVAVAKPSAERLAAVQAITKPSTGDAGEDEYTYGFRLWEAKFYPEAVQQLSLYVDKYPKHARISFGRNLLGRAYLDDGKPREAAPWFLKNYQADKQGARAGDSLLYLAQSMIATGDTSRACIALAEFGDTYPALAAGRLKNDYEANRKKVTCR